MIDYHSLCYWRNIHNNFCTQDASVQKATSIRIPIRIDTATFVLDFYGSFVTGRLGWEFPWESPYGWNDVNLPWKIYIPWSHEPIEKLIFQPSWWSQILVFGESHFRVTFEKFSLIRIVWLYFDKKRSFVMQIGEISSKYPSAGPINPGIVLTERVWESWPLVP